MPDFNHLHVHTQYSLLDGAANIKSLIKKAKNDGMKAVAITDHGNMFGVFNFVNEANKQGIKPIIGCEFYLVENRHKKSFTKEKKDIRYHQLILAKNKKGYNNLSKLCSLGFIEGLYGKYPRIDKELILKYKEGLIATTSCIAGEVPQTILQKGEKEAEKVFKWWLDIFGDDYYVELQRHKLNNIDGSSLGQEDINRILIKWAKKYNVKIISTNDTHYINKEDFEAHDILLCINTGDLKETPIGNGRGYRFGFPNSEFYFKSQIEMNNLFSDIPAAIDFTNEVVDKVENINLEKDILLPNYQLPKGFKSEYEYLRYLTYEGAKKKYKNISSEIKERIESELRIINEMGFNGYFLIVQDFVQTAKKLNVRVGPGRGSVTGSVVAYCIDITNIDPIRYKLLFERFLNPERVSMPDIDIDFDDAGRQKVLDYVVNKYGREKVAQIITFQTMAARMAIRDVARVLNLPLSEADRLAKMVPKYATLNEIFSLTANELKIKYKDNNEIIENINKLKEIANNNDLTSETIKQALKLEGSVRNAGIHPAGVIISPENILESIPVCTLKDTDLWVTQFDGNVIEKTGMLKMDFLGLKTLTIINDAIENIKETKNIDINPEEIPLDDEKTLELYRRGETIGTFQFESKGMQKYLKELKANSIDDLIAMNALFRPGPMQFIDDFIKRKHGEQKISYPHPALEEILKETYGIMVYQEQIMQTARIIADYSLGEADILRRIISKKKKELLPAEEKKFVKRAIKKGCTKEQAKNIFSMMAKFGEYGFNKSHAAAYTVVAFQTAYLKAHFPAEYMAAVLTNNMDDIEKVSFFMNECKRMGIKVLVPDINESTYKFVVNDKQEIRFGLGAIKGVGESAVKNIVDERKSNGKFLSIYNFIERVNIRSVNKKVLESLALAGAFDSFNIKRSQFFAKDKKGITFIESLIQYANTVNENKKSKQITLTFDDFDCSKVPKPEIPKANDWSNLELLTKEKEVVGIYISGHPLDDYKMEIKSFCNNTIKDFKKKEEIINNINKKTKCDFIEKSISIGGILKEVKHGISKKGKNYCQFQLEDYTGSSKFFIFGEDYVKFKNYLNEGFFVFIKGEFKERWNNSDYDFFITEICLLSDLFEKKIKKITLNFSLEQINNSLIKYIEKLLNENRGNCDFSISVFDNEEKINLQLSKNKSVKVSGKFIEELELQNFNYTLN